MIEVGFPFTVDTRGRLSNPPYADHVEQMIELVLFTAPGERVDRPEFGCGLLERVFDNQTPEEMSAIQFLVQGSLQRWLSDVIETRQVLVQSVAPSTLQVQVQYVLRANRQLRTVVYQGTAAA